MGGKEHAARAAEMLEPVYLARLDWRRVMATLEARLDVEPGPRRAPAAPPPPREAPRGARGELLGRARDDREAALPRIATDEATWARARAPRARRQRRGSPRGDLRGRAREGRLRRAGDRAPRAAHGRALRDPEGHRPRARLLPARVRLRARGERTGRFEAIDRLLREANRPKDRVAALPRRARVHERARRAARARSTPSRSSRRPSSQDDAAAIDTYRAALEVDDDDTHALEALSRLYARARALADLADLTRRRAEQSALPEDEARFRLELARLLLDKLGETAARASTSYQAVVELAPPPGGPGRETPCAARGAAPAPEHKARVVDILRPIYERADDWRHLVAVNGERLALATDDGERVAILRETAELWEKRGGDLRRAFDAMREAFMLDPDDGDAREQLDRLGGDDQALGRPRRRLRGRPSARPTG